MWLFSVGSTCFQYRLCSYVFLLFIIGRFSRAFTETEYVWTRAFFNPKGCQVISTLSHFTQKQLYWPFLVDVLLITVALDPLLFSHCSGWFHSFAACQWSDEPLQSPLFFFFLPNLTNLAITTTCHLLLDMKWTAWLLLFSSLLLLLALAC